MALGLDQSARRFWAGGFDPAGADGVFGPRTRQASRTPEYLNSAAMDASRLWVLGQPTFSPRGRSATGLGAAAVQAAVAAAQSPASGSGRSSEQQVTLEQENLFWQSIVSSTDPADFEAYLEEVPERGISQARREPARRAAITGG